MRELCDQLEAAQTDRRRYLELVERIRREAEAFQKTLGTHDSRI